MKVWKKVIQLFGDKGELIQEVEQDKAIINSSNYEYEYTKPKVFETIEGSYNKWWGEFQKEPKLVTVLGKRRSGKDLLLHSLASNLAYNSGKLVYVLGNNSPDLPNYIVSVDSFDEVPNDSIVVIGEGGIENNSRSSMSKKNVGVSKLLSVISHKGIWIFYASQTGRKLDVNIITESDCILLLEPSLMMTEMERPVIKKLYKKYLPKILEWKDNIKGQKGVCAIHTQEFKGIIRAKMPKWWSSEISTSYKDTEVLE